MKFHIPSILGRLVELQINDYESYVMRIKESSDEKISEVMNDEGVLVRHYDPDLFDLKLDELERNLIVTEIAYRGLCVGIISLTEHFLRRILKTSKRTDICQNCIKRMNIKTLADEISKPPISLRIVDDPRYNKISRLNALSNDFKHNNGIASERYSSVHGYPEEQDIQFFQEDWIDHLETVKGFLLDTLRKL